MMVKPSDPSLVERLKKVFSPLMIYGFLKNEMKYYHHVGGFQLLDLITLEPKSHVIPYKFKCSHWWKIILQKKILYKICSPV